jgi:NAD(P)-dependent dehydrogenase (short-subunit alcohol dehydrogenase family)
MMSVAPIAWITGGSRGLGRALVKQLYAQGFEVYFTGRDQNALAELGKELSLFDQSNKWHSVVLDQADLQQFSSLDTLIEQLPKLDFLVNNAGVIPKKITTTAQGFEQAFGVNYLAHFVLTQKLWPKLLLSQQARVINVSSLAFGNGVIDWQQPRAFPADGWQAYSTSKLALILFSHGLAARCASSAITVNSVCPGIVDSDLLKDHPLFPPSMLARLSTAMQSCDAAAEYLFWLSTADTLKHVSDKFFSRSQSANQPLSLSIDEALSEKLWQYSMRWTQEYFSKRDNEESKQLNPWAV